MSQSASKPADKGPADLPLAHGGRRHAALALYRYIGDALTDEVLRLVPAAGDAPSHGLLQVELPEWASDLGVGSPPAILVDPCCILPGEGPAHARCDWLSAAFLHLEGWLERSVEASSGPIQSYAFRLPGVWTQAYDHAFANRIGLLLRRSIARQLARDETELFGPLPEAAIILTHDVDALSKNLQLRIKTGIMAGATGLRHLAGGRISKAWRRFAKGLRFVASAASYDLFDDICAMEAQRGFRSIFFFADEAGRHGFKSWLIDPAYKAGKPPMRERIRQLRQTGWSLGIHPGYETWGDSARLALTRAEVSRAAGEDVRLCRQHWLRFAWAQTWKAQQEAGVAVDFTLGFNDRPGFRNGSALRYRPWDHDQQEPMLIEAIPTMFMDSHFYDYSSPDDPVAAMAPWIEEVLAVRGEASLIWHSQTMHPEYGWAGGYLALLDFLKARNAQVVSQIFPQAAPA
jgi:hypothetical protein